MRWRVILHRRHDRPPTEVLTVDSVAALADVIRAAQADRTVTRREHFRVREWIGPQPSHLCAGLRSGWSHVHTRPCLCGTDHRLFDCDRCAIHTQIPEPGPGCGPLPWQATLA